MKTAQTPQLYCNEPPNRGQESYSYTSSSGFSDLPGIYKTLSKREFWKDSAGPESRSARHCGRDPCPVLAVNVSKSVVLRWCLPFCKTLSKILFCNRPRSRLSGPTGGSEYLSSATTYRVPASVPGDKCAGFGMPSTDSIHDPGYRFPRRPLLGSS